MQHIITIYDYILLPFYILLFSLIVKRKAKKYNGTNLKKIFVIGFALHMLGSILHSMVIQYYYGYSDSFGFYLGGNVISDLIAKDITAFKYFFLPAKDIVNAANAAGLGDAVPVSMPNDSNAMVMKICALVSFFTFNKYLLISLTFGFFSFIGLWKLFKVFNTYIDPRHTKLLAFGVLYTPTIWFWSSGVLKESIAFGCLGIIILYMYEIFIRKLFSFRKLMAMLMLFVILTIVKGYITAIFFLSLFAALYIEGIKKIKNKIFRYIVLLGSFILIINAIIFTDISFAVEAIVNDAYAQIQMFQNEYQKVGEDEDSKGTISGVLKTQSSLVDISIDEIILTSPQVIFTCLFRPFLWETRKVIILFASLEATLTLLVTAFVLWKSKLFGFFIYAFRSFHTVFCFFFSILFAMIVGFTTFNFGTMVRYKIILLPFFFLLLISVYEKSTKKITV